MNSIKIALLISSFLYVFAGQISAADFRPNKIHPLNITSLEHEIDNIQANVQGKIPTWLNGSLLRVGPGKFESSKQKVTHPFDGLALLTRFTFDNGSVFHSAKFLRSAYYQRTQELGKFDWSTFTQDPCKQRFWSKVAGFFTKKELFDNANVNIGLIEKHFVAMTEAPIAVAFNPQTLETLGHWVENDQIAGQITTAHPQEDPSSLETINCLTQFGPTCYYNIFSRNAAGQRTLIAAIPTENPSYLHSFALTPSYIVLVEMPFHASVLGFISQNAPFYENYTWNKKAPNRFLVIDRKLGKVIATLEAPNFFFFHHVNAFEQNQSIVLDIVRYNDPSFITDWFDKSKNLQLEDFNPYECYLHRYTLDLTEKSVTSRRISEQMLELPRINDSLNTRPYSFVYGMGFERSVHEIKYQLVKTNVIDGSSLIWQEEGCDLGEPVFVPAPNATAEDDGVIIATVLNTKKGNSFAIILDAKNMHELARATVPHHIPFALHGNFYKDVL